MSILSMEQDLLKCGSFSWESSAECSFLATLVSFETFKMIFNDVLSVVTLNTI